MWLRIKWFVMGGLTINVTLYALAYELCGPGDLFAGSPGSMMMAGVPASAVLFGAVLWAMRCLMNIRSVAEGAILWLWERAERYRQHTPERQKLERRIVAIAQRRLGTRKRTARMIVNEIAGIGHKRMIRPA